MPSRSVGRARRFNTAARPGIDHDTVVRAAYTLVDSSGPAALTLAALATTLCIRTPSLYNHIAGLPGLHRDLALLGDRELERALTRATVGRSRDDAVRALAGAYRAFVHQHPGVYEIMLRVAPANRAPDPELETAERDVVLVPLAILAGYDLHGVEALHAVRHFRSLVHGFVSLEAGGGFGLPLDIEESFRRLVDLYIEGLHHDRDPRQVAASGEQQEAPGPG